MKRKHWLLVALLRLSREGYIARTKVLLSWEGRELHSSCLV